MPNYGYICGSCDLDFDVYMTPSKYQAQQSCPECGSAETKRYYTSPNITFVGDGWVDKNLRIADQMTRKNQALEQRQKDRYRVNGQAGQVAALTPNVDGEQTDSWAEAQKLATSKGKDASGYAARAQVEQRTKNT